MRIVEAVFIVWCVLVRGAAYLSVFSGLITNSGSRIVGACSYVYNAQYNYICPGNEKMKQTAGLLVACASDGYVFLHTLMMNTERMRAALHVHIGPFVHYARMRPFVVSNFCHICTFFTN